MYAHAHVNVDLLCDSAMRHFSHVRPYLLSHSLYMHAGVYVNICVYMSLQMRLILSRQSTHSFTTHKDVLVLLGNRGKSGAALLIREAKRRFANIYGYELVSEDAAAAATATAAATAAAAGKGRADAAAAATQPNAQREVIGSKRKAPSSSATATAASAAASSTAAAHHYFLRSPAFAHSTPALSRAYNHALPLSYPSDSNTAFRGLLMLIFAVIHAEGTIPHVDSEGAEQHEGVTESRLWKRLQQIAGITKDTVSDCTVVRCDRGEKSEVSM